jgi:3'-5' exoribonuclease
MMAVMTPEVPTAPTRVDEPRRAPDSETTIATARPGAQLRGVFACTRKDRLLTRTGSPYLAVELRDRTGPIQARVFRDADALAARFERGELVHAEGRIERFRDELVMEIERIERAGAEADPSAFLPQAYRDLEEIVCLLFMV